MGLTVLAIVNEKNEYQLQEQPLNNALTIPFNLNDSPFIARLFSPFQSMPYPLTSIVHHFQQS